MSNLPQRLTVVAQTVDYIKKELARRRWQTWLPNERELCENLCVSRGTLRTALRQLSAEKIIRPEHGRGNRIIVTLRTKPDKETEHLIGFLTPQSLLQISPLHAFLIDELRGLLNEHNFKFHVISGRQYFRKNPDKALRKLLHQYPCSAWMLMGATPATQAWFHAARVPCLLAGTPAPGVELPFVDRDHYAVCRHAAGTLLGMGHRLVAFVVERTGRAGESASTDGFKDGVRASGHEGAEAVILSHDGSVEGIATALKRLMTQARRPTALLVANSNHYLTVTSRLTQLGLRIPADISVVSRDGDPFLSHLLPGPAHYEAPVHLWAKKLLRPLLELSKGHPPSSLEMRIMPRFIRGDSLAPLAPGR